MEKVDFLPLGSVVRVKNGLKKIMIIARGLATKIDNQIQFFDYGACLYPEGLTGDNIIYFNHKDIESVFMSGYSDEDDEKVVNNIKDFMAKSNIKKGDPYDLNIQNIKKYSV